MFPLHELVFADPDGARHPELYLRCHGPASVDGDGLHLPAGAAVSGDSYFGVFPLAQWRRLTDVATLALRLTGSGEVDYEISSFKAVASAETTLLAGRVALHGTHVLPLALPPPLLEMPDLYVGSRRLPMPRCGRSASAPRRRRCGRWRSAWSSPPSAGWRWCATPSAGCNGSSTVIRRRSLGRCR